MYSSYYPVTYYFYPLLESTPNDVAIARAMAAQRPPDTETLLYVHIPYCQDMCRFCPFHVRVDKDFSVYERYTRALCNDIARMGDTARAASGDIRAIYFGGGSPSVLSAEQIDRIYKAIFSAFRVARDVEISFEGEPRTLGDPERLAVLREHGTERISFGLQTYDEGLRGHFNIAATLEDVARVTRHGRDAGFPEINVDMMYNLPGQSLRALERDIERLVDDGFDSVDYYNLHYFAFPPKFKRQMAQGEIPPKPSDGVMMGLFEQLRYRLMGAGYANVADQIHSRRDAVCEYFRLLWGGGNGEHRAETLAVGASARGYVAGLSWMNHGNVNRYMDAVEKGESLLEKTSTTLHKPENRGAVMFPKFLGIEKRHAAALASVPEGLLEQWLDAGLLYDSGDRLCISERGKLWTNNMTTDLFEATQRQVSDEAMVVLQNKDGVRTGTF